jgi:hypothetical protein
MLCEMRYCATSRSSCTRSSGSLRALADRSRRCLGIGWLMENSGKSSLCLASRVENQSWRQDMQKTCPHSQILRK